MAIEILNTSDTALRFETWGPGYLTRSDDAAFGTVVLRPGDEFGNHLHEHHTESFFVIAGEAEIWFDRAESATVSAGDMVRALPGVEHYLRNTSTSEFRALFIKSPWVDQDKIERPWTPEEAALFRGREES